MSFWGKTAKIASISMMAAGGAITVAGAVLLGVGCNATYTQTVPGENGQNMEYKTGVGASNFGKFWINGKEQTGSEKPSMSYWDMVNQYREYAKSESFKNLSSEEKKPTNALLSAADETIAGAVLLPIFVLILGAGLAIFFINKKKA